MTPFTFPPPLMTRERPALLISHKADRKILGGRRLLANQRAFAIPDYIIGARPTMPAAHPLPVLDGQIRADIVEQTAGGPAVMGLAGGMVGFGPAIQKDVWTRHPGPEYERMARIARIAPLHQIK